MKMNEVIQKAIDRIASYQVSSKMDIEPHFYVCCITVASCTPSIGIQSHA